MAAAAAGAGAAANTRDVFVRTWFMAKKDDDAVDHIRGAHQIKFAANPAHPAEQIAFSGTKPGSGILCAPKAKLFAINTTNLSCRLAHVTGQNSEQWCVGSQATVACASNMDVFIGGGVGGLPFPCVVKSRGEGMQVTELFDNTALMKVANVNEAKSGLAAYDVCNDYLYKIGGLTPEEWRGYDNGRPIDGSAVRVCSLIDRDDGVKAYDVKNAIVFGCPPLSVFHGTMIALDSHRLLVFGAHEQRGVTTDVDSVYLLSGCVIDGGRLRFRATKHVLRNKYPHGTTYVLVTPKDGLTGTVMAIGMNPTTPGATLQTGLLQLRITNIKFDLRQQTLLGSNPSLFEEEIMACKVETPYNRGDGSECLGRIGGAAYYDHSNNRVIYVGGTYGPTRGHSHQAGGNKVVKVDPTFHDVSIISTEREKTFGGFGGQRVEQGGGTVAPVDVDPNVRWTLRRSELDRTHKTGAQLRALLVELTSRNFAEIRGQGSLAKLRDKIVEVEKAQAAEAAAAGVVNNNHTTGETYTHKVLCPTRASRRASRAQTARRDDR